MGMTSMLLTGSTLPTDLVDSLSLVMASSGLLLALVSNMQDVRKVDSLMMKEFKCRHVAPISLVQDAVDFCRPLARTSNVSFDLDLPVSTHLMVQSNLLRQARIQTR